MNKVQCPICDAKMPAAWSEYPDYPFCSKRCRMVDLGRWLNEDYKLAKPVTGDEDLSTAPEQGD